MADTTDVYLIPHTREWFTALERFNPQQALHTCQILGRTGREKVCGVCGDAPASDFRVTAPGAPAQAVMSIRLCADCKMIRTMQGEALEQL
jgi:hypothetical protein